jgi:HSP20 family protein
MIDDFFRSRQTHFSMNRKPWNPPTDIFEHDEFTVIRMELAGLTEDSLRIVTQENLLIVSGQRENQFSGSKLRYHLMEVPYGEFERIFEFSHPVQHEDVQADYSQGFLELKVRRVTSRQVTHITVRVRGDL